LAIGNGRHDDLRDAARRFRGECSSAVRTVCVGSESSAELLMDAACTLVERLLVGVQEHLPTVKAQYELQVSPLDLNKTPPDAEQEMVVLEVGFHTDNVLAGEIATRSRIAAYVQLKPRLRFALARPHCDNSGVQPLVLFVDGLELPTLPDCVQVRNSMRAELGDSMSCTTAYEWWEQHRHKRFSLSRSKFHRVLESLLEQKSFKLMGKALATDYVWNTLHTTDIRVQALEFCVDPRQIAGVSVSVRARPLLTQMEEEDRRLVKAFTQKTLLEDRARADRFAPSAINVGAMLYGAEVGAKGACPRVLAKLFTAAKWYGKKDDGTWHSYDVTWNCTDRKDIIGRVTEENGRLIWRLQDRDVNAGDDLIQPEEGNSDFIRPSENRWLMSLFYVTILCLLLAVATVLRNDYPLRWLEQQ